MEESAAGAGAGAEAAAVLRSYWDALQARDWPGFAATLHPQVEIDWPATAELITGRDAVVDVNRFYPEGWSIDVLGIAALGDVVASEVEVAHPPIGTFRASSYWRVEGGLVRRGVEYWVQVGGEQPPEWRQLTGVTRLSAADSSGRTRPSLLDLSV